MDTNCHRGLALKLIRMVKTAIRTAYLRIDADFEIWFLKKASI